MKLRNFVEGRLSGDDQHELAQKILDFMEKKGKPVDWSEIISFVKDDLGMDIDNWLDVRGSIQLMKNNDITKRDPDVRKEIYHLVD